jgi:hypothetical protein
VVAAIFMLVMQSPWIRPSYSGTSLLAEQTPVGAANFIAEHQLTGRLFHPQDLGITCCGDYGRNKRHSWMGASTCSAWTF